MSEPEVLAVAAEFATPSPPVAATPLAHGHIHATYVVTCGSPDATERIVVQRLNGDVFGDIDALTTNLERITTHLRLSASERGGRSIVADPVLTRAGNWTFVDVDGTHWRASRFVEGTRVLGTDATTVDLGHAARAFAELTRDLDDLDPGALADTIPRFHDFARRRADLEAAIETDRVARATGSLDLIDRARRLGDRLLDELSSSHTHRLPSRIVHNDAKLDNVLVDSATGAVVCIVDLDTVMPGTVLNDFGELARTAASRAAEDEPDPSSIELDHERFAALAGGYIAGARSFLVESERECLALAGPLLTMENAVRFLTDHLDGDRYFRIHRADHNAQRSRAQLRLAELMLDQLDELRTTIAHVASTASLPSPTSTSTSRS
jgi:hypothetical protein